jgi:hypothetical protein
MTQLKKLQKNEKKIGNKKSKKNEIKYPNIFFRVSAIHQEFVNRKVHDNTDLKNKSRGKGDIFGEIFIETHPEFAEYKKQFEQKNTIEIE